MQQWIAIGLMIAGALWMLARFVKDMYFTGTRKTFSDTPTKNSDAPAPLGIGPYVQLVEKASPTATAETRWNYVAAGLTEAEVLRLEVDRLGKASP